MAFDFVIGLRAELSKFCIYGFGALKLVFLIASSGPGWIWKRSSRLLVRLFSWRYAELPTLEVYSANPLGSPSNIRLIEISKSATQTGDELTCRMIHVDLNQDPDYTTLSYSLAGLDSRDYAAQITYIECDGKSLPVRRGLLFALTRCIDTGTTMRLWVDQLCINQGDSDERAVQIQLMHRIFGQASKTLMWVGDVRDVDSDIASAFEFLETLCTTLHNEPSISGYEQRMQIVRELDVRIQLGTKKQWRTLANILTRPWFSRVWVIQEVALAKNGIFCCAATRISWFTFCQRLNFLIQFGILATLLSRFRNPEIPPLVSILRIQEIISVYFVFQKGGLQLRINEELHSTNNMKALMRSSRWSDTSEPVDRVYALLGLCDGEVKIVPNYAPTNTIEIVYRQLALELLRNGRSCHCPRTGTCRVNALAVLSEVVPQKDHNVPTWVPVWKPLDYPTLLALSATAGWQAGGDTQPLVAIDDTHPLPDRIHVKGLICDGVAFVSEPCTPRHTGWLPAWLPEEFQSSMQQVTPVFNLDWILVQRDTANTACRPQPGSSIEEDFVRTLCGNFILGNDAAADGRFPDPLTNGAEALHNLEAFIAASSNMKRFVSSISSVFGQKNALEKTNEPYMKRASAFYGSFEPLVSSRSFFITQSGGMGIGPPEMRPGDCICVFLGAYIPFVLRPVGDRLFQVIGECYLHGAMDGEAMGWIEHAEDITLV